MRIKNIGLGQNKTKCLMQIFFVTRNSYKVQENLLNSSVKTQIYKGTT